MPAAAGNNKHHYLPQMYLRRWTTHVEWPRDPYVFAYHRGRLDPERSGTGNIGYERGLYRVRPETAVDGDPEVVERAFGPHEDAAKRAFDAIDESGRLEHAEHVVAVANFVALFLLRTLKGQRGLVRRTRELATTLPDDLFADPEYAPRLRAEFLAKGAAPEDVTDAKLMEAARRVGSRLAEDSDWRVGRVFSLAEKASPELQRKHWCVVTAEPPAQFIASDAPVLVPSIGPEQAWWKAPPVGIAQDGAEVWLPLDPRKALVASSSPLPRVKVLPAKSVDNLNQFSMETCLEYVVCHRRRPKIAAFMAALSPHDFSATGTAPEAAAKSA